MDVAESVAHFINQECQFATRAIAEIDRQRIEGVAEQAGIAEQQHPPAGQVNAALGRATLRIGAQRRAVALAVVGLVETVERRPVDAEQRRLPVRLRQPVEIDQKAHHAIAEAMAHRFQPRMHHLADVKRRRGVGGSSGRFRFGKMCAHGYSAASASSGGGSRHGATAPSASATARPDRNPSS